MIKIINSTIIWMAKTSILITGSSGFIGSNIIKSLKDEDVFYTSRTGINGSVKIECKKNKNIQDFDDIVVLHLATHFSKNNYDQKLIYDGNIAFGLKLLEKIESLKIKKIIYTNTMFNFYKDDQIRDLVYTKTKYEFSKLLQDFSNNKKIKFEEIFLDNTFGINDKRKKIIPLIIESIYKNNDNPIKNPNIFINTIYVEDVVQRLKVSLFSEDIGKSCFIENKQVNIFSIYEFLKEYYESKKINFERLIYQSNDYIKPHPPIDYKKITRANFEKALVGCFDESY